MFKHLLVPLDGSKLAELALPMAKAMATQFDSSITLLQVVTLPYAVGFGHESSGAYSDLNSLNQEMKREAITYMEAKRQALHQAGIQVDVQVVMGKSPAEAILTAVDELGADTIVMSTHGRSGLMRWVFGSVADKVLRQAKVPILLARVLVEEKSAHEAPASETGKV
jgi:nucleotide-binding universal stress UspA family protein